MNPLTARIHHVSGTPYHAGLTLGPRLHPLPLGTPSLVLGNLSSFRQASRREHTNFQITHVNFPPNANSMV